MKRLTIIMTLMLAGMCGNAQTGWWVMLTDKAGTTFDPYTYFDSKAIERYRLNGADLYDQTNYPLNEGYVEQVGALATEAFGESRWLNAVAVTATEEQIAQIGRLPFVREVVRLEGGLVEARAEMAEADIEAMLNTASGSARLHKQLVRMGGKHFRDKGIDGRGVRIAVLDGGFPQVNTHAAFKHLRDEGRIIKTWNFPNKKEDVYGWNSHGLMTLCCIVGRQGDTDLGMATGAEVLLARTEIADEPFKEEVWWQMGMEWADKNGAQIISSSLGYGKDRYYTKDMNGESYVAKAGNLAARKGILVCNSAGNEGDDKRWRTIITPSDADSVLCVGGINPSLKDYERTSFSSYGPSADGRQKPNVTAFAYAWSANTGKSDNAYHLVPGTSFSCPLVAGFAACALQSRPGTKAMELFHEIERSGDLYPYCDYTYGYGVPQADHFTGDRAAAEPTFKFERMSDSLLRIVPLKRVKNCHAFVKNGKADGTIFDYRKWDFENWDNGVWLEIGSGNVVTANIGGYTESYAFNSPDATGDHWTIALGGDIDNNENAVSSSESYKTEIQMDEEKPYKEIYLSLGLPANTQQEEFNHNVWSPAWRIGLRRAYNLTKAYALGYGIEYGHVSYKLGSESRDIDRTLGTDNFIDGGAFDKVTTHRLNFGEVGIELFQRVRLRPCGLFHRGWHWDLGVYGNFSWNTYKVAGTTPNSTSALDRWSMGLEGIGKLDDYRWNWGLTTRISRDWLGLYARYRMNGMGKDYGDGDILPARLEAGVQVSVSF